MSTSEYRRLVALEQLLIDARYNRRPTPPNIEHLRDEYRRLMAQWFRLSPRERWFLQQASEQ